MPFEFMAILVIALVVLVCQHLVIVFLRRDVENWREKLTKAIPECEHQQKDVEYLVCQACGAYVLDDN